jgi:hypothetical protein
MLRIDFEISLGPCRFDSRDGSSSRPLIYRRIELGVAVIAQVVQEDGIPQLK